jgi:hypothetical protein
MKKENGDIDTDVFKKYKRQLDIWHRMYNINRDKLILCYDFLISLYELIDETFLGVDVLYNEVDQKNHFNWCWNQVIDNFLKEKINFKERGPHYEYFWTFFFEAYYVNKLLGKEHKISEYLDKLFDFRYVKTESELDILSEVYNLLNQNLKK